MPASHAATEPSIDTCNRWLAVDAEQRLLQLEWGTLAIGSVCLVEASTTVRALIDAVVEAVGADARREGEA